MEKLHKSAEVDDLFKAVTYPDSDDEEMKKAKSKPESGTDRKCDNYKIDVSCIL